MGSPAWWGWAQKRERHCWMEESPRHQPPVLRWGQSQVFSQERSELVEKGLMQVSRGSC